MEWETFLWILGLLIIGAMVFLSVFVLISFADLESDYINPIDLCSRINQFVMPEYVAHGVLTLLLLLSGYWLEFLFNLPMFAWHINNVVSRKMYLDPTSIFSKLSDEKKKNYVSLGYYMISFFYYLYRLIYTLVQSVVIGAKPPGAVHTWN